MLNKRKKTIASVTIPYAECIAKTFNAGDGTIQKGRTVFNHCQIVGEVAREMIRRLPSAAAQVLFPTGPHFAAANHDVGKVSPTFYNKIMRACGGSLIANVGAKKLVKSVSVGGECSLTC